MEPAQFRHQIRGCDGIACLVVSGELDLANVRTLRDALDVLTDEARSPAYVDFSGVTFCDSTVTACLVRAARVAAARGVTLQVVDPSPITRRVLELSGLDDVLIADGAARAG